MQISEEPIWRVLGIVHPPEFGLPLKPYGLMVKSTCTIFKRKSQLFINFNVKKYNWELWLICHKCLAPFLPIEEACHVG